LWPREHGAWGLLIAPLAFGTIVGARASGAHWLAWAAMITTVSSLFLVRTPLEALLGFGTVHASGEREVAAARNRALLWGGLAAVAGVVTAMLVRPEVFAACALIGAVAYATQWLLPRPQAQLAVAIGLAAGAAATYVALTGRLDQTALTLGVLAGVLSANQVSFVQLEINALKSGSRRARLRFGFAFLIFQALTMLALAAALEREWLTRLAVVAFVPLLARGFWHFVRPQQRISLRRLGFTEIGYTTVCVLLLALGVRL
jgi:hypothetical protein